MDQKGEVNSDVFGEQLPQVRCFVRNLTYYRSLVEASPPNEDRNFWEEVSDAFLVVATLAWYNVFGSCGSDLHWSKLIENMPKKDEEDFRNRIYKSTDLNEESYKKFRDYIKTLRDKYFAHKDLRWQEHILNSPDFENALKIAEVYECWVNDLLQKENSSSVEPLANIIQSAKEEVKHVLSSQKR